MSTLSPTSIASWPTTPADIDIAGDHGENSIATTTASQRPPQWDNCLNALLGVRRDAARQQNRDTDAPSLEVLEAAMQWLVWLREFYPQLPPTSVIPEPAGGLIIERRAPEIIYELTLYNDLRAEMTYYENNKVIDMIEVPFNRPPRRAL